MEGRTKIENNDSPSIGQPGVKVARTAFGADRAGGPQSKDQLAISEDARLLMKAHVALRAQADVRADQVAALRHSYASGAYTVPFERLASRMRDASGMEEVIVKRRPVIPNCALRGAE